MERKYIVSIEGPEHINLKPEFLELAVSKALHRWFDETIRIDVATYQEQPDTPYEFDETEIIAPVDWEPSETTHEH